MSNDRKTTLLGAIMAALLASTVDWQKVFMGQWDEIAKALGIIVVAVFSYYVNKQDNASEAERRLVDFFLRLIGRRKAPK